MHIRPVFWFLLAFACCAVLVFAGTIREHTPALMQVRVDKAVPVSVGYTTVELHLSDPQNIPIYLTVQKICRKIEIGYVS